MAKSEFEKLRDDVKSAVTQLGSKSFTIHQANVSRALLGAQTLCNRVVNQRTYYEELRGEYWRLDEYTRELKGLLGDYLEQIIGEDGPVSCPGCHMHRNRKDRGWDHSSGCIIEGLLRKHRQPTPLRAGVE